MPIAARAEPSFVHMSLGHVFRASVILGDEAVFNIAGYWITDEHVLPNDRGRGCPRSFLTPVSLTNAESEDERRRFPACHAVEGTYPRVA